MHRAEDLVAAAPACGGRFRPTVTALLLGFALATAADARPALVPLSPYTSFDPTLSNVVGSAALSPDGRNLAYLHGWNPVGRNPRGKAQLFVYHFDDGTVTQITPGDTLANPRYPTWSPDGQYVYFSAESATPAQRELYRATANGSGFLRLTFQNRATGFDPILRCAPSAGGGVFLATSADLLGEGLNLRNSSRNVYFRRPDGTFERLSDPDSDLFSAAEVYAADAAATGVIYAPEDRSLPRSRPLRPFRLDRAGVATSLTPPEGASLLDMTLTPRGHLLYLASTADYLGGGSSGRYQLFRRDMLTGTLSQLTSTGFGGSRRPGVDSAGVRLVFESSSSLLPGDVTGDTRVYLGNATGGGLKRIGTGVEPTISGNGQWLAFRDATDSLGFNPDLSPEIFAARTDGTERRQITRFVRGATQQPDVSADGSWVVFSSTADLDGGNPDGSREIYRCRADGSELRRLTSTPRGKSCEQPSVNATGTHVVFVSSGDLITGDNDDGNLELFLIRMDGDSLQQITKTGSGTSGSPRLADDAGVISFITTSPVIPNTTMGSGRVAIWTRSTNRFRLVTPAADRTLDALQMDDAGKRLAILTSANLNSLNVANTGAVYTVSTSGLNLVRLALPAAPRTGGLGMSASGTWIGVSDVAGGLSLFPYDGGTALPVALPAGLSPVYPTPTDDGTRVACALPSAAGGYKAGDYVLINRTTSQVTALIGATQARPPEPPGMSGDGNVIAFTLSSVDSLNPDGSVEVMAATFNAVPVSGVSLTAGRDAAGDVRLLWHVLSGDPAAGYIVERGNTATGPWREIGRTRVPRSDGAFEWTDTAPPLDAPWYRLGAIERDGRVSRLGPWNVAPPDVPLPRLGVSPNPFVREALFDLELPVAGRIRLEMFDVRGRRVKCLLDRILPPGLTRVAWNGTDDRGDKVAAGVYYCRLNRTSTVTVVRSR